jgi:hypothetical protein
MLILLLRAGLRAVLPYLTRERDRVHNITYLLPDVVDLVVLEHRMHRIPATESEAVSHPRQMSPDFVLRLHG